MKTFSERIEGKYEVKESGCWQWSGAEKLGYGLMASPSNKQHRVHRLMYAHTHGPIPPWLLVAHDCMNKGCINPEHLSLGTHKDNAHYKDRCKLTIDQVESMRKAGHSHAVDLAKEFGISKNHVHKVIRGDQW